MIYKNRNLNWKPSRPEKFGRYYQAPSFKSLPSSVDLRKSCAPVKDQGEFGACSGFSSSVATEFLELKELKSNLPPSIAELEYMDGHFCPVSPMFIYNNERLIEGTPLSQDAGATTLVDACKTLTIKGVCRETTFPYTPENLQVVPPAAAYAEAAVHKVPKYWAIQQSGYQMMSCLAEGYPFLFGIVVFDSMMSDEVAQTGQVPLPTDGDSQVGGHALCCVGYEHKSHWIFQNSWGPKWGDKGFGYLPWEYLLDPQLGDDFLTLRY